MSTVFPSPVPVEIPRLPLRPPELVRWWTMVAPSRALPRGGILRVEVGELSVALFRGRGDGIVRALPAHCLHQGADLGHGEVVGDCLRCPLHHWEYSDRCERIPGAAQVPPHARRAHWVTAERYGMIFIHPGDEAPLPIPSFLSADEQSVYFLPGTPVDLDCPWYVPVANAFDMTHLRTVHQRELISAPVMEHPNRMTFVIRYSTRVVGRGWSDRAMRALSGNQIDSIVTCAGGTMVMIEATAGPQRSFMMISIRPVRGGISILPLYGVLRRVGGLHALHARAARALFNAFLARDVRALRGIRFPAEYVDTQDPTINACYRHLCQLPEVRVEER